MNEPNIMYRKGKPPPVVGGSNFFNTARVGANIVLSNNNQRVTIPPNGPGVAGARSYNTGKHYFEIYIDRLEGSISGQLIGIATAATPLTVDAWTTNTNQVLWYAYRGVTTVIYKNDLRVTYGKAFSVGDYVGVALDLTSSPKTIQFYLNGVGQGVLPLATYVANQNSLFTPFVESPNGSAQPPSISTAVEPPHYLPAGFTAW